MIRSPERKHLKFAVRSLPLRRNTRRPRALTPAAPSHRRLAFVSLPSPDPNGSPQTIAEPLCSASFLILHDSHGEFFLPNLQVFCLFPPVFFPRCRSLSLSPTRVRFPVGGRHDDQSQPGAGVYSAPVPGVTGAGGPLLLAGPEPRLLGPAPSAPPRHRHHAVM